MLSDAIEGNVLIGLLCLLRILNWCLCWVITCCLGLGSFLAGYGIGVVLFHLEKKSLVSGMALDKWCTVYLFQACLMPSLIYFSWPFLQVV